MSERSKHPNSFIVKACCLCTAAVAFAPPDASASGPINPGDDIWGTPCGGGAYVDFSANPIPAGFFAPGSDPFSGQIMLGGDPSQIIIPQTPLSGLDTIVRRGGTSAAFACGSSETVSIEIIALSLVSCSPVQVTFGGANPQLWDLRVCLDGNPQTPGSMTINHECQNGGSYTSSLPVNAQLTFTEPAGGGPAAMPHSLNMGSSGWWSHFDPGLGLDRLNPGVPILDLCTGAAWNSINLPVSDFFPGLWSFDCIDCLGGPGTFEKPRLTPEQALLAAHGVYPPNPEKQPGPGGFPVLTEACCLQNNTCVDVEPLDCVLLWGGIPQGLGTNCANTPCGGGQACPPLDPTNDLCAALPTACQNGTAADFCRPSAVVVQPLPPGGVGALVCDCYTLGDKCGPIDVDPAGDIVSCPGGCPSPNPPGNCVIFADVNDGQGPLSQGVPSVSAFMFPPDTILTCGCDGTGPPPDDHITVDPTVVDFGGGLAVPPIPADFFDPGSDPFDQPVAMEGTPGGPSVRLQRSGDPVLPADPAGASGTVAIEIVALDLRSSAPVTVTYGPTGPTEQWELRVSNIGSSGKDGVSLGSFSALKDHPNGGTFTAAVQICPVITFTRVLDGAQRVLDLCSDVGATPLELNLGGPFTHNVDPVLGIAVPAGATMTTGIEHEDIGAPGNPQSVVPVQAISKDVPPSVIHNVTPPPLLCPLVGDPAIDPCAALQMLDCQSSADDQCRPIDVTIGVGPGGGLQFEANTCDCITPGNKCGPVDIIAGGQAIACPGGCPAPNPPGNCFIHVNGGSIGVDTASVTNPVFGAGDVITCRCTTPLTGACCFDADADGTNESCVQATAAECATVFAGTYHGDGSLCQGTGACCFGIAGSSCVEVDGICCDELLGTFQGVGSTCADADMNGVADVCEITCLPNAAGTACDPIACSPVPEEHCMPRCVNFDPLTGASTITDCDCRDFNQTCWVNVVQDPGGPAPLGVVGPGDPCVVVDNGGGTVSLPPAGCEYLSPEEVHQIIDGLPAGVEIQLAGIHKDIACSTQPGTDPFPWCPPSGLCEDAGGNLGGNRDCFESTLALSVDFVDTTTSTVLLHRDLLIPQVLCSVDTAVRTPGDALQDFDTDMFHLEGHLFGDPDFAELHIVAGTDFSLPSPGHTTLTRLGPPGGNWQVDSFFDVSYRIDFIGAGTSTQIAGLTGSTTATLRMSTTGPPGCAGSCPAGTICEQTEVVLLDGTIDVCCDCVPEPTGACCLATAPCQVMTQLACIAAGGQYAGDNSVCGAVEACCLPTTGACINIESTCCTLRGGVPQGVGSDCTNVDCVLPPCEPNANGSACEPVICPDVVPPVADECQPRCVNFDPITGQSVITDCDCRRIDECHVEVIGPVGGPVPEGVPGDPCVVVDNGSGTVTLPPDGCAYLSPEEVHVIVDGLPAGTTLVLAPIHSRFLCEKGGGICSVPIPPLDCEASGGSLGGNVDCFGSSLDLSIDSVGTGLPPGFHRDLSVFVFAEVHTGLRNPGDPVQDFDTDMFRLQGELFGDPDFCTFRVRGGTDFGLPSPGHTTLTRLPSGNFAVDSFFDVAYEIQFVGCPSPSPLAGMAGTTQATIRMQTGGVPQCVGGCPVGESCRESAVVNADGTIDMCCDCVPDPTGCNDKYDCGDTDGDLITDDVCVWYECVNPPNGTCNNVVLAVPSDMGGAFGACPVDGFCNIHDRNHALRCFSGTNGCSSLNIDAGGAFGACPPDGFCNIHDANHALTCFAGTNTCTCPPGPAPERPTAVVGWTGLTVQADRRAARPGEQIEVRVFTSDPVANLQSYQLHLAASGGRRGQVELVNIRVEERGDFVFAGQQGPFDAFNVDKGQMIAGIDGTGIKTPGKAYMATFTYRVSADAVGAFVIDVLHDQPSGDQTFLVSSYTDQVEVTGTKPAVIVVAQRSSAGVR